jgi:hypothetical protein
VFSACAAVFPEDEARRTSLLRIVSYFLIARNVKYQPGLERIAAPFVAHVQGEDHQYNCLYAVIGKLMPLL